MKLRNGLGGSRKTVWVVVTVAILVLLAALWWTASHVVSLPPRVVVMSTGPAGSAFAAFAERYREAFARVGIDLRLRPSAGSIENLALLKDPRSGVSVGFAEGGLARPGDESTIESLGTMFFEPLWLFSRGVDMDPDVLLGNLAGKRVSIGLEGSGTRALALRLLAMNEQGSGFATLLSYPPNEAADRLLAGELDAAAILTSWDSPAVRRLLASPSVDVHRFPRADAYVALHPYLTKLTLPMGVGNLARNRPPADVTLLAVKAGLVVRNDLHPAIQYLLLDAATRIHGGPGIFNAPARFPAAEAIDLPLSDYARTYLTSGRPFLQRYLPFWLAVFAGQALVLLIPIVGVLYPLLRVAPALYGWSMRRRIFRLYGELKFLEDELERRGAATPELLERLDRLEARVNRTNVPLSFRQLQYTLRLHIGLVRARLEARRPEAGRS